MKKIYLLFICAICVIFSFSSCTRGYEGKTAPVYLHGTNNTAQTADAEIRAMWLSQFDMKLMCLSDGRQRPFDEYEARVALAVSRLLYLGINTVFIQMRPNGDSLYPSALFPSSAYAVGSIGAAFEYDPIAILLDALNEADISAHAWINPLRLMSENELSALGTDYTVGKWYTEQKPYISCVGGYGYLDPSYDEVQALIISGAQEILDRYSVDGIHIDDYFYPTSDAGFDAAAYEKYTENGGTLTLADFRRGNITHLISGLYTAAHERGLLFGVSPSGNMARNYGELFADVEEWCALGTVDYLCPQIYFGFEHGTLPFEKAAEDFLDICRSYGVDMLVGLTLEKAYNGYLGIPDKYAGSGADEWIDSRGILARCVGVTRTLQCRGFAFFSYRLFFSPDSGSPVLETADEVEALRKVLTF